ncbi:hypothetical protein FQA39_LY18468 [Lamprigera yunnana]|nr:hypothetical protein FQA39_LY18468 [Lamprigera yunnana]
MFSSPTKIGLKTSWIPKEVFENLTEEEELENRMKQFINDHVIIEEKSIENYSIMEIFEEHMEKVEENTENVEENMKQYGGASERYNDVSNGQVSEKAGVGDCADVRDVSRSCTYDGKQPSAG